jgi:hypothetical protein
MYQSAAGWLHARLDTANQQEVHHRSRKIADFSGLGRALSGSKAVIANSLGWRLAPGATSATM